MPGDQLSALIFTECEEERSSPTPFAGGEVVVYSARSPDKDTPNEDAAAVLPAIGDRGVLVVADGVGGRPGGQSAARTAIQALERAVADRGDGDEPTLRAAVLDSIEDGNRRVLELGGGAATTLAAVEIEGRRLRPYHVGDSGILVVGQRGSIKQITVAHSPVGYAVESGMLDEDEAMHHEERHLVSNIVGSPDMRIEVGSWLDLAPFDSVVLASDGMFDNVGVSEIAELVRSGPVVRAADRIAAVCRSRMTDPREGYPSKPDDLTFIIFRPRARRDRRSR